jgi:hypothetical protein
VTETIPEYGVSINIEQSATVYLREKALDAIEEQIVEDANAALEQLSGRGVLVGSDIEALRSLSDELHQAKALVWALFEIALAKTPAREE